MNIESTFAQGSQARPGVRFTMRVLNQYQRAPRDSKIIDARVQVSEFSRQLHAILDPDAEIDEIRVRAKKEEREVTADERACVEPDRLHPRQSRDAFGRAPARRVR
jgi:hypothetical protein